MFLYNLLLQRGRLCGGSKFDVFTNVPQGRISSRRFAAHSLKNVKMIIINLRYVFQNLFNHVYQFCTNLRKGDATLIFTGKLILTES